MILGPLEIAFIVGIGLLLLGPDKVPKLGKALGNAMREYQDALKGIRATANSPKIMTDQLINNFTQERSEDDDIIESAKQLGIQTEGKTIEQISREILDKF